VKIIVCVSVIGWVHGGHSPGKSVNWKSQGNLRMVREKSGGKTKVREKIVLACGQLARVFFLTQNMQERSYILGIVLYAEHSCHSCERIYSIAVKNKTKHAFRFISLLFARANTPCSKC